MCGSPTIAGATLSSSAFRLTNMSREKLLELTSPFAYSAANPIPNKHIPDRGAKVAGEEEVAPNGSLTQTV